MVVNKDSGCKNTGLFEMSLGHSLLFCTFSFKDLKPFYANFVDWMSKTNRT